MSNYNLDPLNDQAIASAVSGEWQKAVEENLELTKKYPDEAEIFNRLAKAYIEVANLDKAKAAYKAALKIDPYNHIAKKNLEKVNTMNPRDLQNTGGPAVSPDLFIEEPGKTKMVTLEDLAMGKVISTLKIGDRLKAAVNGGTVILLTAQDKRIGKLDEEAAQTVSSALRKGSKFDYIVKSVELTDQTIKPAIFVKETFHSLKLNAPVFAPKYEQVTPADAHETDELRDDTNEEASESDTGHEHPVGESSIDEMIAEAPTPPQTNQYDEENDDVVTELPDMDEEPPAELRGETFDDHEDTEDGQEKPLSPHEPQKKEG